MLEHKIKRPSAVKEPAATPRIEAMPSKGEVADIYRKRAKNYDFTVRLYNLLGFRIDSYREEAIESLRLKPGNTVIDIACGTGANFPMLQERIGPGGKIIGVDFTDAMLAKARERVEKKQWRNVELVQSDAALYQFPAKVNGVISTFATLYMPEFDDFIRNGSKSLVGGGRMVILDFKLPNSWISRLAPFALIDTQPWGLSIEMASRHPWESMSRYLKSTRLAERYGGFVFVAVGERQEDS
jgi:demethylmenaquinone methyltransferase/2-methoxy-6-polyprenyl-1,4-benzoquinol methylase